MRLDGCGEVAEQVLVLLLARFGTVRSRSTRRSPRLLCEPRDVLRRTTPARNAGSASLSVGSTPGCTAK